MSAQLQAERSDQHLGEGLDRDSFTRAFRNHAAGVAIVTADDGTGPAALTATSVFSLSAEPAIFAFSISDLSTSGPTIRNADSLVVHLLSADQVDLATLCSTRNVDRFGDTSQWSRLVTGEPLYHGVPTWIRGKIIQTVKAGTSTLLIVQALEAGFGSDEETEPLVYHMRTWHRLTDASTIS